jgi:CBS domain-containing protein
MQVQELMSRDVHIAGPGENLLTAARAMARADVGALPVGENDRLIGMITDRDIIVRGLGAGRDPATTSVREVMSGKINYCFEDEDVDQIAHKMAQLQIRRLPVLNRDKRMVGIISLGDISREAQSQVSGHALRGVSLPAGAARHAEQ